MARALSKEELSVWKKRISRHGKSGLPIAEFCRQESVSVASFHYWKRKLGGASQRAARKVDPVASNGVAHRPATFVQVPLPERRGMTWIEIVAADGTQVRLPEQNLDALELALAAISGRNNRLQ